MKKPMLGLLMSMTSIALVVSGTTTSSAQERIEVEGTADFRNPPILSDGRYLDTIVAGEAVWYGVLYSNNNPLDIRVDLVDIDLETSEELTLDSRFVSPSLAVAGQGLSIGSNGSTWSWPEGSTNLWYIQVELTTTGRLGVEHQLSLDISGMQNGRLERCGELPDCDLDTRLAEIEAEITQLEQAVDELPSLDAEQVINDEIDELQQRIDAAKSTRTQAEATVAELCRPQVSCETVPDPGVKTPLWATGLGGIILAGGAGFMAMNKRKLT